MWGISLPQLLIILAVVLLIFGTKRLRNVGADLGHAIKGFRKGVKDDEPVSHAEPEQLNESIKSTTSETSAHVENQK